MKRTVMVKVPTAPFDPGQFVETPEDAAIFLTDALESRDPAVVAAALGVLARAPEGRVILKGKANGQG